MLDGDIEEVENPQNPNGPSFFFRLVMLKATEKVGHKKEVETDKAKHDANDLAFRSDDVDLGWKWKAISKALQNITVGKELFSGSSAMRNAASASVCASPAKPAQASGKPGPPLAMQRSGTRCCARMAWHSN